MEHGDKFYLVLKIFLVLTIIVFAGLAGYYYYLTYVSQASKKITSVSFTPVPASLPEYQGRISALDVIRGNDVVFSFKLDKQIFFFSKTEIVLMKVENSKGEEISYKDLRVGQNIILNHNYDTNDRLTKIIIKTLD